MTGSLLLLKKYNDFSLPPLGCNRVNLKKLWKTGVGHLCFKTSNKKTIFRKNLP